MRVDSVATLVNTLRQNRMLPAGQLEEVTQDLQGRFSEPRALAKELLDRNWLTAYQVNHLLQGRIADLVLGPYLLLQRVGEGAMGTVFKARHAIMKRVVALKVIREELLTEPAAVDRFYQQIQAASQLSHPHIVHAYDAGPIGRTHFFAMEFVEGTDLGRLVQKVGPLDVDQACDYIRQAALGLQHAYERGLLHRDLKPANLLLASACRKPSGESGTLEGHPSQAGENGVKVRNLGLTLLQPLPQKGAASGATPVLPSDTFDFIAPERSTGDDPADIRADLYSLGCVFYFLLTGQVPFPDGSPADKLRRHREEAPRPIEELRPEVPPEVAAIVRRLLAKDPNERHQTPGELAAELTALRGPQSEAPLPASPEHSAEPASPLQDLVAPAVSSVRRRPAGRTRGPIIAAGVGVLTVGLLAGSLILVGRERPRGSDEAGVTVPTNETPEEAIFRLGRAVGQPEVDPAPLRRELLALQAAHMGTPIAVQAAQLLRRLPSALDQLSGSIPAAERVLGQPAEVVAVLGEQRQRHWGQVWAVAYQPDGKRLASGGQDGPIRLWDAATMTEQAVLTGHSAIRALAFTPDGRTLASAGADNIVRLWDMASSPPVTRAVLKGHTGAVRALAFTHDGRMLATGGMDNAILLWDVEKGHKRGEIKQHTGGVLALVFTPDGKGLFSGSVDKTVRQWDVSSPEPRERGPVLKQTPIDVHALALTPDGRFLAVASRELFLLDLSGSTPVDRGVVHGAHNPRALIFTPDGKTLIAGGSDGVVRLWTVADGKAMARTPLKGHTQVVHGVALGPGGKTLASASADRSLRLWDLESKPPRERSPLRDSSGELLRVAFTPDGTTLAGAGADGKVRLWSLTGDQFREKSPLRGHAGAVQALAFAPGGKLLASGGVDKNCCLWDITLAEGKERKAVLGHPAELWGVAFGAGDRVLVTACQDRLVRLYDLGGSEPRARPVTMRHAGPLRSLAVSADGRLVAFSGQSNLGIQVWQILPGAAQEKNHLKGHTSLVVGLAFSLDGKQLASVSHDRTLRLWDLGGPEVRSRMLTPNPGEALGAVAWSSDGQSVVSAGLQGQITWWDAHSGKPLRTWALPGPVSGVALAPDGRHIATANANGTAYILRLAAFQR